MEKEAPYFECKIGFLLFSEGRGTSAQSRLLLFPVLRGQISRRSHRSSKELDNKGQAYDGRDKFERLLFLVNIFHFPDWSGEVNLGRDFPRKWAFFLTPKIKFQRHDSPTSLNIVSVLYVLQVFLPFRSGIQIENLWIFWLILSDRIPFGSEQADGRAHSG